MSGGEEMRSAVCVHRFFGVRKDVKAAGTAVTEIRPTEKRETHTTPRIFRRF